MTNASYRSKNPLIFTSLLVILFLAAMISGLTVFAGTYRDQDVLEADVKIVEEARAGTGGAATTDEQNSHIVMLDIEKGYTAYAEVMPEGIHGYVNSATVGITGMKSADRPEPVVLIDPPQSATFGPYDVDSKMQIEFKTNPEGDITVRKTYTDGVYLFKCEDLKKKESDEDFDDFILKVIIIKVDAIEAVSSVANNSPQSFEGYKTDFGDPCSDGYAPGQALIIFFEDVHGGYDDSSQAELVADFDVNLKANILPDLFSVDDLNESWAKAEGPDSGALNKTDTFEVKFQNPKKGGLYKFEFELGVEGCAKSGVNILMPLAGAESGDFVRSEFQRITNWVDNQLPDIPIADRLFAILLLRRALIVSTDLDYSPGHWEGGDSPCKRYSLPTAETLTVEGVVMESSKLANMMWAVMMRRFMYWDWFVNLGADVRNRIDWGWREADSDAAKASYELGRDLYEDGIDTLYQKMREYRELIREPDSMANKVFPSKDVLVSPPIVPNLP